MYYYRLFVMLASERIFKIGKYYLGEVTGNWLIGFSPVLCFHALSCLKVQISPDNLRMLDRSCHYLLFFKGKVILILTSTNTKML